MKTETTATPSNYISQPEFAALLNRGIRSFFKARQAGKIPPPDGKFPHSKAYYWNADTVAATVAKLAKGGDV